MIIYKIQRKRNTNDFFTDLTDHYDMSGEIPNFENAMQWAREYKEKHKSDHVRVVRITKEFMDIV